MKNITVRPAQPEDAKTYADWLVAASNVNLIADPEVLSYPTCNTAVMEKDGEPVLINSFHLVMMPESLAPRPGVAPMDEVRALKAMFDAYKKLAEASGVREIWFGCKDESLIKFIEKRGFERISFPMFRFKLEKK